MKNILFLLFPIILSACIADPPIKTDTKGTEPLLPQNNTALPYINSYDTEETVRKRKQKRLADESELKRLAQTEKDFNRQTAIEEQQHHDAIEDAKYAEKLKRAKEKTAKAKIKAEKARLARLEAQKKHLPVSIDNVFRDRLKDGSKGPAMVWIKAGSFKMGSNNGDADEKPVHMVKIDRFAMGKYEVTFSEYDKFAEAMGRNKPSDNSRGRGNRPVINISWTDATAYTLWLHAQTGHLYRLPTEAEWEYAARAGTETIYWWGNDMIYNNANCQYDSCIDLFDYTVPVDSFAPNPWGLYNTVGNVWEWVQDYYDSSYYSSSSSNNPTGPTGLQNLPRVRRGGSWYTNASNVRAANRGSYAPTSRDSDIGFRLVRTYP
ncbi:MAG: formylglycine-generating enzyme family protein [Thiomargarita sp.]|nr:formylglycine-generating enzyme family protein [Thiomargarita sp.]